MNTIDLKAHRCPEAMVMVRLLIESLMAQHKNEIEILTIEPMLLNHIRSYLAAHGLEADHSMASKVITDQQFEDWRSMKEAFDDDDFENCNEQHVISLKIARQK